MIKEVIRTDNFLRQLKKIDKSILDRVKKLVIKIIIEPETSRLHLDGAQEPKQAKRVLDTGKPMRFDRKGTREVYAPPFRLNYIYDRLKNILIFLDIYHKDKQ